MTGNIYMWWGTLYKLMLAVLSKDMAPSFYPATEG